MAVPISRNANLPGILIPIEFRRIKKEERKSVPLFSSIHLAVAVRAPAAVVADAVAAGLCAAIGAFADFVILHFGVAVTTSHRLPLLLFFMRGRASLLFSAQPRKV